MFTYSFAAPLPSTLKDKGLLGEKIHEMEGNLRRPLRDRVGIFHHMGDQAYEILSSMVFAENLSLQTRWKAVTTLGRLNFTKAKPILEKALRHNEWFIRNAALIASRNGDRAFALAWSERLLQDSALVVRTAAVQNLVELNAKELGPVLWERLFAQENFKGGQSLWIRHHIAKALVLLGVQGEVKDWRRLLQDQDERLHSWALQGIVRSNKSAPQIEGLTTQEARRKVLEWAKSL